MAVLIIHFDWHRPLTDPGTLNRGLDRVAIKDASGALIITEDDGSGGFEDAAAKAANAKESAVATGSAGFENGSSSQGSGVGSGIKESEAGTTERNNTERAAETSTGNGGGVAGGGSGSRADEGAAGTGSHSANLGAVATNGQGAGTGGVTEGVAGNSTGASTGAAEGASSAEMPAQLPAEGGASSAEVASTSASPRGASDAPGRSSEPDGVGASTLAANSSSNGASGSDSIQGAGSGHSNSNTSSSEGSGIKGGEAASASATSGGNSTSSGEAQGNGSEQGASATAAAGTGGAAQEANVSSPPPFLTAQQRCRGPAQNESVPQVVLVKDWPAPRPLEAGHVTLVTQANLERQVVSELYMLHNQCRSWPFPLAAAIYVPQLGPGTALPPELAQLNITTSLEEAQQRLTDLHSLSHQEAACNLRLQLYTEACDARTLVHLPANAMRNRALQMAQTEVRRARVLPPLLWLLGCCHASPAAAVHGAQGAQGSYGEVHKEVVFMLDVDFIVSREFVEELSRPEGLADLHAHLGSAAAAIIVPALQARLPELKWLRNGTVTEDRLEWAKQLAFAAAAVSSREHGDCYGDGVPPGGKARAVDLMRRKETGLVQFNWGSPSRKQTDIARWMGAGDYYPVLYQPEPCCYEPDVIMRRDHIPWFDERFRGYGMNKATVFAAMHAWAITFAVHPRGYTVHVAHGWSKSQRLSKDTGLIYENIALFNVTLAKELQQGTFWPVTGFPDRCPLGPASAGQASVA
ncbi:hypothetical protein N2152v2_010855 [Parachlorella kessleri]